jgi:hypothetical protein
MSFLAALLTGLVLHVAQGEDPNRARPVEHPAASPVRAVLQQEAYPWYDGQTDQVRPVLPDRSAWLEGLGERINSFVKWLDSQLGRLVSNLPQGVGGGLGELIPTLLFMCFGAVLIFVLWRLWRLHEPQSLGRSGPRVRVGETARIAGLAQGASLEGIDPWSEALRCREAGDRAGAVIWLFLDQLLALERLGLIRLTPGRTARHYVIALTDQPLCDGLRATLGLFEDVYYGHRIPSAEALDSTWSRAEGFRRRLETFKAGQ